MNNKKFNFAFVISIIVLLLYSYIVFMGIVYWKDGNIVLSAVCAAALVVVTLVCIIIMCKAKATRWQRLGKIGQWVCGAIIFVALGLSTMPFAHFINLVMKQGEITASFEKAHKYGTESLQAYKEYVNKREIETRDFLHVVNAGRGVNNPSQYEAIFGLPGNDSNSVKIDRMITSLHMTLLPDSLKESSEANLKNLEKGAKMTVWNIAMPQYINNMDKMVKLNVETLGKLSRKAHGYRGDNYEEFRYKKYTDENAHLKDTLTKMSPPSIISIIAALLCFAFMLLPYFLVERNLALETSGKHRNQSSAPLTRPNGRERRSRLREREQRKS